MPRRKEEINVNLVFENGAYRVVDVVEFHSLLGRKAIVFEKVVADKGLIGHFYRKAGNA